MLKRSTSALKKKAYLPKRYRGLGTAAPDTDSNKSRGSSGQQWNKLGSMTARQRRDVVRGAWRQQQVEVQTVMDPQDPDSRYAQGAEARASHHGGEKLGAEESKRVSNEFTSAEEMSMFMEEEAIAEKQEEEELYRRAVAQAGGDPEALFANGIEVSEEDAVTSSSGQQHAVTVGVGGGGADLALPLLQMAQQFHDEIASAADDDLDVAGGEDGGRMTDEERRDQVRDVHRKMFLDFYCAQGLVEPHEGEDFIVTMGGGNSSHQPLLHQGHQKPSVATRIYAAPRLPLSRLTNELQLQQGGQQFQLHHNKNKNTWIECKDRAGCYELTSATTEGASHRALQWVQRGIASGAVIEIDTLTSKIPEALHVQPGHVVLDLTNVERVTGSGGGSGSNNTGDKMVSAGDRSGFYDLADDLVDFYGDDFSCQFVVVHPPSTSKDQGAAQLPLSPAGRNVVHVQRIPNQKPHVKKNKGKTEERHVKDDASQLVGFADRILLAPPTTKDGVRPRVEMGDAAGRHKGKAGMDNFAHLVPNISGIHRKQVGLLKDALRLLKTESSQDPPMLLYATNSMNPLENEAVICAALTELAEEAAKKQTITTTTALPPVGPSPPMNDDAGLQHASEQQETISCFDFEVSMLPMELFVAPTQPPVAVGPEPPAEDPHPEPVWEEEPVPTSEVDDGGMMLDELLAMQLAPAAEYDVASQQQPAAALTPYHSRPAVQRGLSTWTSIEEAAASAEATSYSDSLREEVASACIRFHPLGAHTADGRHAGVNGGFMCAIRRRQPPKKDAAGREGKGTQEVFGPPPTTIQQLWDAEGPTANTAPDVPQSSIVSHPMTASGWKRSTTNRFIQGKQVPGDAATVHTAAVTRRPHDEKQEKRCCSIVTSATGGASSMLNAMLKNDMNPIQWGVPLAVYKGNADQPSSVHPAAPTALLLGAAATDLVACCTLREHLDVSASSTSSSPSIELSALGALVLMMAIGNAPAPHPTLANESANRDRHHQSSTVTGPSLVRAVDTIPILQRAISACTETEQVQRLVLAPLHDELEEMLHTLQELHGGNNEQQQDILVCVSSVKTQQALHVMHDAKVALRERRNAKRRQEAAEEDSLKEEEEDLELELNLMVGAELDRAAFMLRMAPLHTAMRSSNPKVVPVSLHIPLNPEHRVALTDALAFTCREIGLATEHHLRPDALAIRLLRRTYRNEGAHRDPNSRDGRRPQFSHHDRRAGSGSYHHKHTVADGSDSEFYASNVEHHTLRKLHRRAGGERGVESLRLFEAEMNEYDNKRGVGSNKPSSFGRLGFGLDE